VQQNRQEKTKGLLFTMGVSGRLLFYCVLAPHRSTAARSRQNSWASSAKKIWPLEKKLGRKPATHQIIRKSAVKNFCYKFLGQLFPIIVLGRKKFYWAIFGSSGPEFGHLAECTGDIAPAMK
jgi:hypothetical protein